MLSAMESVSLKDYCKREGVTALSDVRTNKNGYPFVTVLRGSDAENLYFSKRGSARVKAGDTIRSIANDLRVHDTMNAKGEQRTKLGFDEGVYADVADLF